jgi:membrane fusion protein (multidrug efflux system)
MTTTNQADLAVGKTASRHRTRKGERRWLRLLLIAAGPVALAIAGGYFYIASGRYVSTDNAYVRSDISQISTEVNGRVDEVEVRENQLVKAGQVLFRLEDTSFKIAVERAEAQIATARLDVEALRATYAQKQAELKSAQDTLDYQGRELDRQKQLFSTHVTSQQQYDQAQHNLDVARQNVDSTRQALANVLASLGGDPHIPTHEHPRVLTAKAMRDQAQLDLAHTVVYAPIDGTVAQVDKLQKGMHVTTGTPLFSLIGRKVWVEANFKETELTHMKPGQEATIEVDTYPDRVFKGTVGSISPGTGSEFSVLPPQNATGNWVKIVQRLPVRIMLNDSDDEMPLRSGMSVTAEVDTHFRRKLASLIDFAFAGPSPQVTSPQK